MKNLNALFPALLIVLAIVFQSNIALDPERHVNADIEIPDNVKAVLDNKCFGCHNTDSKAEKAKGKLLLDKLGDLSKTKMISTLSDIAEVASDGAMPPEKFLEQKPEMKLTTEEQKTLAEWAQKAAQDLLQ
jgi:uncharacterized membrane protein